MREGEGQAHDHPRTASGISVTVREAALGVNRKEMATRKPRHANCKVPQPDWMMRVKVGDVIRRNDGPFRIVREVTRYKNGELRSVTLVIRRCSWTHRCYTILNSVDLRTLGYRIVRVKRRRLRTRMDRKIRTAINEPGTQKSLTCCDVEGMN